MKTIAVLAAAVIGIGSNISLEPASKVWVEGTSSVRGFKCNATDISSVIATSGSTEIVSLVDDAQVTIPVAKLDCGNGTMNEHMRKALKASQSPNIEFKLDSYKVEGTAATLLGTLQIAGTTKSIEIPGTVQQEGSLVRVKASKQINMTQWGVKPPSLMMGTMKVKENVTVGFDVTLKP
jgi:polyisoprenoid-binding protein YceI